MKDYDASEDLFGIIEKQKWDNAHFQAGLLTFFGICLVAFIEGIIYLNIYSLIK